MQRFEDRHLGVSLFRFLRTHGIQIKILIHPKSYVHAIIKFNNGITKILIHDTDMSIPIYNSIYDNKQQYYNGIVVLKDFTDEVEKS